MLKSTFFARKFQRADTAIPPNPHYSTRDTETTRLGSWADQRYSERSNEQAKYLSISPCPSIAATITHHPDKLADPVTLKKKKSY